MAITGEIALVVGDMHCKQDEILPLVDDAVEEYGVQRVVFLGDYADEWDATAQDVLDGLALQLEWAQAAKAKGLATMFLLGNHDLEYLMGERGPGTHMEAAPEIKDALRQFDLLAAACVNGYLVSHGGLTSAWREEYLSSVAVEDVPALAERINELLRSGAYYDLCKLAAVGPSRGGHEIPSPIWADKADLEADATPGIRQIVGHTPVKTCAKLRLRGSAGCGVGDTGPIWLCDTFSLTSRMQPIGDGSMLLLDGAEALPIATDWLKSR